MKNIAYISLFFLTIIINSCGTDDGNTYFDIKKMYKEFINDNDSNIVDLDLKAQKIDAEIKAFVSDYPESEYLPEMKRMLQTFEKERIEKLYQNYLNKNEKYKIEKFPDYESKILKTEELINDGEYILLKAFKSDYSSGVQKIVTETQAIKQKIYTEKEEFSNLMSFFKDNYSLAEADAEKDAIKSFLYKYPNSVKALELQKRLDDLSYVKFKLFFEKDIKTIKELNAVIDTCKIIKNEISDDKYVEKCNTGINKLEKSRKVLFKREWQASKDSLEIAMEQGAKDFSNNYVHEFCENILSSKILSKDNKDFGSKSTYIYTFELQSKCGFACSKICKSIIKVTGTLYGNEETGVLYDIDSELISDEKID